MFIVLRQLTDVSKPIRLSSRDTILKYDFHGFESADNPMCFPSRLNLHIGILKKKSYKAKKSYTVLLKKKKSVWL